jgi:hypothetical protein
MTTSRRWNPAARCRSTTALVANGRTQIYGVAPDVASDEEFIDQSDFGLPLCSPLGCRELRDGLSSTDTVRPWTEDS